MFQNVSLCRLQSTSFDQELLGHENNTAFGTIHQYIKWQYVVIEK